MEPRYHFVFMYTDSNFKNHSFHIEDTKPKMLALVHDINSLSPCKALFVFRFHGTLPPLLVYNKGLVQGVTW